MRAAIALLLAALGSLAAAQQRLAPVEAVVARNGGAFVADFTLPADAGAWAFWRSNPAESDKKSWRAQSWRVLTPGVRLERRGRYDAFVAASGGPVPRRVRVAMVPFTGEVTAQYVPALLLGGGSVAVFDGHFSLFSVADPRALDTMGGEPDPARVGDSGTRVQFLPGRGPFRLAGDVEGFRRGQSNGAYGLFDVPRATVAEGVATVIDAEMPAWFAGYIRSFTPQAIRTLTRGLGRSGLSEPTILAAWEGAQARGASMNGGTLKGLILMRIEGQAALTPNPELRDMVRWFIAHEAAHFWLGQAVGYQGQRDNWIMEGGADLLAARTIQRIDRAYSPTAFLNKAIADCAVSAGKPVALAPERGEHRAAYACGTVFSLVAERASGGDFYAFTRRFIGRHRARGEVNSADWLAALAERNPAAANDIRAMLGRGAADPAAAIATLFRHSGIVFRPDPAGVPVL